MQKPIEPSKDDCCNSGCNPCIFDIYEKQLKNYEKYLENGEQNNISLENGISQLEYTKFIIVKSVIICDMHKLILFKRLLSGSNKVWWEPGHHFLYKYSSNEVSCTRAYTPISIKNEPTINYDFAIILKKYEGGNVSSYVYNLDVGSITSWRGPYGHYIYRPKFDRIIMIAQGTGIAPFIAIIDCILNNEEDMTKIILLYCCKCINTILFRDVFYSYKSYWNFNYEIYLSTNSTNLKLKYQEPIKQNKLKVENIYDLKPFSSKDQFLVCGSDQFNNNFNDFIRKEYPETKNIILF